MEKKEIDYELAEERPTDDHGSNGGNSETKDGTDKWAIVLTIGVVIAFATAIAITLL